MTYTVSNTRNGFENVQGFASYGSALDFYKHECSEIGGPVLLCRWDDEGNLDAELHNTAGW